MGLLQLLVRKIAAIGAYFRPRNNIQVETLAQLVAVLDNYTPLNISAHSSRLQQFHAPRKHLVSSAGPRRNDLSSQYMTSIRVGWMSRPRSASFATRRQQKTTRPTLCSRYQKRGIVLSGQTEHHMDRIDARKTFDQPRLVQKGPSFALRPGFVSMDEVRSHNCEQARLKKEAADRFEASCLERCRQKAEERRQLGIHHDALFAPGGTLQHWKHPQQPLHHATVEPDLDQARRTAYHKLYECRHAIDSTLDSLDLHNPNSFKALVDKLMLVGPTLKEFSDQLCDRTKLSHLELGLGWNWEALRQVYWNLEDEPSESLPEEVRPICQSISETFALVGLDLGSVVPTSSTDASDDAQIQAHNQLFSNPVTLLDDTFKGPRASSSELNSFFDTLSFEKKHSSDDLRNKLNVFTPMLKQLSASLFGENTKASTLLSFAVDDLGWNWNRLQQVYWILRNKSHNSLTSVETKLAENIETALLSVGLHPSSPPQASADSPYVPSQLPSTGQTLSSANDIPKQDGITFSVVLDALADRFSRVDFHLSPCTHSDPNYHRAFGQVPTITMSASSSSQGNTSLSSSQSSTSVGSSAPFQTIINSSSTSSSSIVPVTASGTPNTSASNDSAGKSLVYITYHGFTRNLTTFVGLDLGGLSLSDNESVQSVATSSNSQNSWTKTTTSYTFKPSSSGPSQRMLAESILLMDPGQRSLTPPALPLLRVPT